MQFDGPLGSAKMSPVKQLCAQIDDGRVQTQQRILETKSSLATPFGLSQTTIQQAVKNLFVQLPGSMLIGIAEGGALGRSDSKMMQFSFTASQTSADLPQAMSTAQLAKQHGHKLSPAAETACMALGFGLQDQLLKLPARKKLEKLTENAAKSIHGRVLLVRLFDKPNLTRSTRPLLWLIWTRVTRKTDYA